MDVLEYQATTVSVMNTTGLYMKGLYQELKPDLYTTPFNLSQTGLATDIV